MSKIICVVGTDTEIGKTYACCQILQHLARQGLRVAALKPIASGQVQGVQGDVNEDVLRLHEASTEKWPFEKINAFCFKEAIAPHIAARHEHINLNVERVLTATQPVIDQRSVDVLLIEGVGGVMTPLNALETYLDLLRAWRYPIVLIVGMRLGCLNHTLLTTMNLAKLNLVGWIANCLEPNMCVYDENLAYLTEKLSVPLLAAIPYQGTLQMTEHFNKVML